MSKLNRPTMKKNPLETLYTGPSRRICGLIENGNCAIKTFIENLPSSDEKKVVALLKKAASHWPINNRQKFKLLEDGIFEFKSYQIRIFCFLHTGNLVILTHGRSDKKKNDLDPEDLRRAKRLRDYFYKEIS